MVQSSRAAPTAFRGASKNGHRSISTLRIPRWATSSYSTVTSAGPSTRSLQLPASEMAKWRRRTYATIVETPTASEDDLPEPLIAQGQESAATTLNVTAAAEKVRFRYGSLADSELTLLCTQQLARIQERENDPNLALRILVESGGCHGYSTKLHVADVSKDRQEDD